MSQLIQLRRKIKSIQTTRKITHAVRLISMSFYARLEKKREMLTHYLLSTKNLLTKLLLAESQEWKNPFLEQRDPLDSNPLIIIVSTFKGLCGSLNSNLFRFLDRNLFIEEQQKPRFITIGNKAAVYVKKKLGEEILCSYSELSSHNYLSITDDLLNKIISNEVSFSSVTVYHNMLKSFFTQTPHKSPLIPFDSKNSFTSELFSYEGEGILQGEYFADLDLSSLIWEQSYKDILTFICTNYLRAIVMTLLYHSLIAEQAARFLAMDNSTTNADKYLEKLVLQFNKQRQALITKEVSELSVNILN